MNEQQLIIIYLSYIISSISLVCTLLNLWLIRIMKKWNGYLAIITTMCYCQIVYDLSFSLHISAADDNFLIALWNSLQFFGGISVSIWTNILAFVILRVVVNMKSTDILKNFYWLAAIALLPAVLIAILLLVLQLVGTESQSYAIEELYYWSRLVSIFINFVIHAVVSYKSYITKSAKTWTRRTPQEIAIQILSQRMIYYPLMQALSRLGASWYEALYGFGPYPGNTSNYQFGLACLYVGLSPATGIGYLIVFLLMQPYAIDQVKALLLTGRTVDPKMLEVQKKSRRSSYINRNTLMRGGTCSDLGTSSSAAYPSDLQNNTSSCAPASSLTAPGGDSKAEQKEQQAEFFFMDDDELVATIHRAELRGSMFHLQQYGSSEDTATATVYTANSHSVFTAAGEGDSIVGSEPNDSNSANPTATTTMNPLAVEATGSARAGRPAVGLDASLNRTVQSGDIFDDQL